MNHLNGRHGDRIKCGARRCRLQLQMVRAALAHFVADPLAPPTGTQHRLISRTTKKKKIGTKNFRCLSLLQSLACLDCSRQRSAAMKLKDKG